MTLPSSGTLTLQQIATEFNQQLPFGLLNNPAAVDSATNIQNAGSIGLYGVNGMVPNYYGASLGRTGTAGGPGWGGNGSAGNPYTKTAVLNVTNEYVGTVSLGYAPTQLANPLPINVTGSFPLSGSNITCSMDTSGNVYATTTGTGFKSTRWQFNFTRSPASGSVAHTIVFDINFTSTGGIVNPLTNANIVAATVRFNPPFTTAGAVSRLQVNPDGTLTGDIQEQAGVVQVFNSNWWIPTTGGIGSSYWCRLTKNFGDDTTGGPALGVWHNIGTTQQFVMNAFQSGFGTTLKDGTFTLAIASDAGGSNIVTTGTYQLYAYAEVTT